MTFIPSLVLGEGRRSITLSIVPDHVSLRTSLKPTLVTGKWTVDRSGVYRKHRSGFYSSVLSPSLFICHEQESERHPYGHSRREHPRVHGVLGEPSEGEVLGVPILRLDDCPPTHTTHQSESRRVPQRDSR